MTDECGNHLEVLPKMVKCPLALNHSKTGVERSLSINKKILTKANTLVNDAPVIGMRANKAAIKECGIVKSIPVTLDMIKATEKSHQLYVQHLKHELLKKHQRQLRNLNKLKREGNLMECKLKRRDCMKNFRYLR